MYKIKTSIAKKMCRYIKVYTLLLNEVAQKKKTFWILNGYYHNGGTDTEYYGWRVQPF